MTNNFLNGIKVVPCLFIPDGEIWVSDQMYEVIKESIPEIKCGDDNDR